MATNCTDRLQDVGRMIENMSAAQRALLAAKDAEARGDLESAAAHYECFIRAQTEVLCATIAADPSNSSPESLAPVVGTLMNGLFMYADTMDALRHGEEAATLRQQARDYALRYLGAAGAAEAQRSAAASEIVRGHLSEALTMLYEVRDRFQALGLGLKAARVTMDLADIHQWLGDYARALELVDEAAQLSDSAPTATGLQQFADLVEKERIRKERAFFRGIISRYLGRYGDAEESLREALSLYSSTGPGLIGVQYQWAVLMAKRGRAAEALQEIEQLEPHMRQHGLLRPKVAAILRAKAEALLALGRAKAALEAIVEALEDGREYFDPDVRWTVEWQHARILRGMGFDEDALRAYKAAAETLGTLRRAPLGYRLDNAYLSGKLQLFREAIELCVERDRALGCAWFIEHLKARSLSAVMAARTPTGAGDPALSREFDAVSRQIDAMEYDAFVNGWTPPTREQRSQLTARRSRLIERLRFSDPRWRNMSESLDLNTEMLQAEISRRNLAVLTVHLDDDRLTTVLLAPGKCLLRQRHLDHEVRERLDDYVANLALQEPDRRLFDPATPLSLSADDLVPREMWLEAFTFARVIVIPHRELHLLPWAGLMLAGRRLFEHGAVGVLPNLNCLTHLATEPAKQPRVSLVGPPDYKRFPMLRPLPGAAREVAQIGALYQRFGRVIGCPAVGDDEATEARLVGELASPGREGSILHVCCHGGIELTEPMSTGLFLSDGKLDAAEISRLRTSVDEVVLSACSTGWRPTQVADVQLTADDCLGLPGALLEAGARNVLVSIPQADDKGTEAFMVRYHTARSTGTVPLEAYRQAQLEMLADGSVEPYRWVGLTMYGC